MNSDSVFQSSAGRTLARVVALTTVPLYAAGMASKMVLDYRVGLDVTLFDVMLFVGFGAFAAVGALLVARRPDNWVSWIMVAIGLITALFPAAESYAAWVMTTRGVPDSLAVFGVWANQLYWIPLLALALVYLPLLFPEGHLLSRRWRWVAGIAGLATLIFVLVGAVRGTLVGQNIDYQIDNPLAIAGAPDPENSPLFFVSLAGLMIGMIGAATAVIVRYRRSRGIERQQLKWFLYAVALYPLLLFIDNLSVAGELLFGLVLIMLPAAVGVAVLRYRLYDIDVVIRKTLIYAALTVLLALVYFGSVILLQRVLGTLTGVEQSPLAIVVSTLIIAALFTPLRRRVQNAIDRRFYRRKYDAQQVLAQFALTARDETDLDALTAELVRVVQETMQPEHVSVWLRDTESPKGGWGLSGGNTK